MQEPIKSCPKCGLTMLIGAHDDTGEPAWHCAALRVQNDGSVHIEPGCGYANETIAPDVERAMDERQVRMEF
jgi:hypothetical protein